MWGNGMRKLKLFISLLITLTILFGCAEDPISTEVGECLFGSFATTDMAGEPLNEQIFSDHKLTMVNMWATFCGPCVEEMPYLAELQSEYGEDLQIIGIVVDAADKNGSILPDKKAEAAAIIEETGADYLHLLPSKSLNQAYLNNVQSVPETVFVDENGHQIGERYLGKKSKAEWARIIKALLASVS